MGDTPPERRLAAVLSADVVGYSRLMAADEDGTVRTINEYREQVRELSGRHNGRLVDFTGDNFLAEFPSALEAVQCALDIQQAVEAQNAPLPDDRRLRFRIGAHLGDVRVDGERLYGEGINIAARLEALADPGGLCLSEAVYMQVRNRLDLAAEEMGPQTLKNIDRPVRAYRVRPGAESARAAARPLPPRRSSMAVWPMAVALIVVVALFLVVRRSATRQAQTLAAVSMSPAAEEKPSIAVLPFANLSGDPEQEYFADGMTEDLITDLSKLSGLAVIARTSSFHYKGKHMPVQDIGRELNVRYIVEGSVRKAAGQVRITAQLVEAATGHHVWSDRFDRPLNDVFALQDEVTAEIVEALALTLTHSEQAQAAVFPTTNLEAYDLYLRAQSLTANEASRAGNARARELLERAVALDPGFARAYTYLSWIDLMEWFSQWTTDPAVLARSEELALKAVELNGEDALALAELSMVHNQKHDTAAALRVARLAVAAAPSAWPYQSLSMALLDAGHPEEALEAANQAIRLNPYDVWTFGLRGRAYIALGRYEDAVTDLERGVRFLPDFLPGYVPLVVVYGELGDEEKARRAVDAIYRISPKFSLDSLRDENQQYVSAAFTERVIAALKRYGPAERAAAAAAEKPAIAVLPFANMSGDPEQEYFADGMTEDLITDLSKVSGLLVIARNSVFTYKGKPTKVQDVARDLDVQYVVEGSVRKAAGRVRITAQLVDAATGHHVWSERYDRELGDVFAMQDDVTSEIVQALRVTLTDTERSQIGRIPTKNMEAYDAYLRGQTLLWSRLSRDVLLRSREQFERAIELDPEFGLAYAELALTFLEEVAGQWTDDPTVFDQAVQHAETAVELQDSESYVHAVLCLLYNLTGRTADSIREGKRAVALNPNDAVAQAQLGYALALSGRAEQGIPFMQRAIRVDPRGVSGYHNLGVTYLLLGRTHEAVRELRHALNIVPAFLGSRVALCAAYAELGRIDEARAEVTEVLRLSPGYTLAQAARIFAQLPEELGFDRLVAALRRAGLPEGEPVTASATEAPE